MATIGIVGKGFVGSAVYNGFDLPGNELLVVDPKIENSLSMQEMMMRNPQFVFVCVPTPLKNVVSIKDTSPQKYFDQIDTSYVTKVLDDISKLVSHNRNPLVVVKSTITPDYWQYVPDNLDVLYNPELLRESNPDQDFQSPPCIVIGGDASWCVCLEQLYKSSSKVHYLCPYLYTTREVASMFKYTINSWLATKVTYFNQLHNLFFETGLIEHWDNFINMVAADPRIGFSHMQVPGPDGTFGFGGSCFPKDTKAFLRYASDKGVDLSVLREAVEYNGKLRKEYE